METDVLGKLNSTPFRRSRPLLPVIEAMVNSFDSIRASASRSGLVEIVLKRQPGAAASVGDGWIEQPVRDVEIIDNGEGFTDENFKSFNTAESRHREAVGGRGVGRFSWLKAFEAAEIDSVFRTSNGAIRRTFRFVPTRQGVEDMKVEPAPPGTSIRTTVRLLRARPDVRFPKGAEVIARQIVEECLEHFILKDCARVKLRDANSKIDLVDLCHKRVVAERMQEKLHLGKRTFTVTHVLAYSPADPQNRIRLCANRREVESEPLHTRVPELRGAFQRQGDQRPVVYSAYVSGNFLDDSVNESRLTFNFDKGDELYEGVTYAGLLDQVASRVKGFLKPHIDPIRERTLEAHTSVIDGSMPWFKPAIRLRPDEVAAVPVDLPEPKKKLEFQRIINDIETESEQGMRDSVGRLMSALGPSEHASYEQFVESFSKYSAVGEANLARYVSHRRAVLALLSNSIERRPDGTYPLEKTIHDIIFPRKRTCDDLSVGATNLWLVDDRLAFFRHLASDLRFNQLEPVEVDSKRRPDLVAFNRPMAYVEGEPPFDNVTIVELKRPVRDEYEEADNPINQVVDYVELIRNGNAKTKTGRPVEVRPQTRFFGYVVCDPTPKIREFIRYRAMHPTADGDGYWNFDTVQNLYLEVIYFSKLIRDAMQRNASFFRYLGLPND